MKLANNTPLFVYIILFNIHGSFIKWIVSVLLYKSVELIDQIALSFNRYIVYEYISGNVTKMATLVFK